MKSRVLWTVILVLLIPALVWGAYANLPSLTGKESLGSASKAWLNAFVNYVKFVSGSYVGTMAPTTLTANRTYTLPNSTGTLLLGDGAAYQTPQMNSGATAPAWVSGETLLSSTTISFAADGNTTLFTVPTGVRAVLTKAVVVAAADVGNTTLTIGQAGALTDFLGTQTLSNLDAQYDAVSLMPVPNATPVKQKSYAAATVIKAVVGAHAGSAGNTLRLYGIVY
jgi:hypothetical protein